MPWECSSREAMYSGTGRRRQDSAADSGSSSSDVSSAIVVAERTRRLPQQSTLDGGLRGAPPPLRRLSAVEPRHLAPLGSPPHSPRPPRPPPAPHPAPTAPPHPTPTISVSSAPDEESADSPAGTGSPDESRSLIHSDEPSSVFASADATPTDGPKPVLKTSEDRVALTVDSNVPPSDAGCDDSESDLLRSADKTVWTVSTGAAPSEESCDDSVASAAVSADSRESDRTRSSEEDVISVRIPLSREQSLTKEASMAQWKDDNSKSLDLPRRVSSDECMTESIEVSDRTSASTKCICTKEVLMEASTAVVSGSRAQEPVAPLAVCEDVGVDDDNVDKVPSAPPPVQRLPGESRVVSESDATKTIAHRDELTSVSESDIVRRDNRSGVRERKQRNDICPWEDE